MSERRKSRIRWMIGGGLVWLGLLGLACGLWYADEMGAFRNCYLRIRTPSGQTTWVEFRGNRLRTAPSSDALEQAQWLPAAEADWEHTAFPEVVLGDGGEEAPAAPRARFDLYGRECDTEWSVTERGRNGAQWTYVVEDFLETARRVDACAEQAVPDLQQLALAIETKPEMEGDTLKLGVGLHVTGAQQRELEVSDIRRDGKSVLARIELKDKTGRTVLSRQQPLSELGFT